MAQCIAKSVALVAEDEGRIGDVIAHLNLELLIRRL
eukprot:CAMPEP_0171458054 /NCGR_PEP_ID=MMETSP0945-20130129/3881_1 /TAXON_ID=109269 /ORGANISM="Vaucheria litorea, Strain CCMP2940" /LENGTH=35 /DNA_ID= /DNA_START= /DNA_END= /DNA_ORIENTATION=